MERAPIEGRLFLFLPLTQLHEKCQHSMWQILWNFIVRPQVLSDHRPHGAARQCVRPRHVIQFIA